jgi:small neutral amino acid transporter SnatA (MarC family)
MSRLAGCEASGDVLLRVVAVLLGALAAEFFILGLRDLGVIAKAEGH